MVAAAGISLVPLRICAGVAVEFAEWLSRPLLAANEPLLERLEPRQRAAVLAAIFGLILLGLGSMLLIWLGGRFVRREARRVPRTRPPLQSDWDRKDPARPNEPLPEDEDE